MEEGLNMREVMIYSAPERIPEELYLKGALVTLRPITYSDTDDIIRWRNDPAVRNHFVFRKPFTKEIHEMWLTEQVETGRVVQWMICENGTDAKAHAVGSVYLRDIDLEKRTAEYGIFIGEADARGRGYSIEAGRLAVRYAFDVLALKTVGMRVYTDNIASKKSCLEAGFRAVRTLPAVESTDGSRADMLWMEVDRGIC